MLDYLLPAGLLALIIYIVFMLYLCAWGFMRGKDY